MAGEDDGQGRPVFHPGTDRTKAFLGALASPWVTTELSTHGKDLLPCPGLLSLDHFPFPKGSL